VTKTPYAHLQFSRKKEQRARGDSSARESLKADRIWEIIGGKRRGGRRTSVSFVSVTNKNGQLSERHRLGNSTFNEPREQRQSDVRNAYTLPPHNSRKMGKPPVRASKKSLVGPTQSQEFQDGNSKDLHLLGSCRAGKELGGSLRKQVLGKEGRKLRHQRGRPGTSW